MEEVSSYSPKESNKEGGSEKESSSKNGSKLVEE
jgi:hypothetical protein